MHYYTKTIDVNSMICSSCIFKYFFLVLRLLTYKVYRAVLSFKGLANGLLKVVVLICRHNITGCPFQSQNYKTAATFPINRGFANFDVQIWIWKYLLSWMVSRNVTIHAAYSCSVYAYMKKSNSWEFAGFQSFQTRNRKKLTYFLQETILMYAMQGHCKLRRFLHFWFLIVNNNSFRIKFGNQSWQNLKHLNLIISFSPNCLLDTW